MQLYVKDSWSQNGSQAQLSNMLQSQDFRVGQVKKPCIKITQENSIKSSVQTSLSFITN